MSRKQCRVVRYREAVTKKGYHQTNFQSNSFYFQFTFLWITFALEIWRLFSINLARNWCNFWLYGAINIDWPIKLDRVSRCEYLFLKFTPDFIIDISTPAFHGKKKSLNRLSRKLCFINMGERMIERARTQTHSLTRSSVVISWNAFCEHISQFQADR